MLRGFAGSPRAFARPAARSLHAAPGRRTGRPGTLEPAAEGETTRLPPAHASPSSGAIGCEKRFSGLARKRWY